MIEVRGKYNSAKIYTDNVEEEAVGQIIELCNQEFAKESIIRIMPDTHAGKGCTIGTTMTLKDKVVPNLVGVDIGCGMEVVALKERSLNLGALDNVIREHIPSGFNVRARKHRFAKALDLMRLRCYSVIDWQRAELSIGTLGGGNHFIEANMDEKGNLYLVIHSGSRNLGKQVAEHYQNIAYKNLRNISVEKNRIINTLTAQGREKEISAELAKLPSNKIAKDLAYLEGQDFLDYIHDMRIVQQYATLNRKAMAEEIVSRLNLTQVDGFTTIHNYIETETMILRKGAISAKAGELVIIPINMRDGSLICKGRGNPEWNFSAPHGAGRLMSRSKAKELISLEEYEKSMRKVWTTSVGYGTIDEAPMAYKPMEEIMDNIEDTADIVSIIKPIYNYKAN